MLRNYKLVLLFFFISTGVFGQTNTLSPYSSFGLGDISTQGVGYSRGLGGTGVGLALQNQINFINPAAYTAQDTLSFIFDAGVNGNRRKYESTSAGIVRNNVYFSHIGLSFPITRWWAATLGAMPYSSVGYNIQTPSGLSSESFTYHNQGTGDLNRYFIGSGVKFKNFSVGLNGSYILGTLKFTNSVIPGDPASYTTENVNMVTIKGMYLNMGAQYTANITPNTSLTLGLIYEFKRSLNASDSSMTSQYIVIRGSELYPDDRDTITGPSTFEGKAVKPSKLGFGLSMTFNKKLLVAMDYTMQDWSGFSMPAKINTNPEASLSTSNMLNFGVQYVPNPTAVRGYLPHVNFQMGGHYGDTYLVLRGQKIKDYGMTVGVGLPFKGGRSMIRVNYELGRRGTTDLNLIRETYHMLSFSLSLYDFWFVKQKFD